MKKSDYITIVNEEFKRKSERALLECERRKSEIYAKIPKIKQINDDLSDNIHQFISSISSKQFNDAEFYQHKNHSLDLQQERAELLHENGYPIDYLDRESVYECQKCKDEGFIGTQMCECYKKQFALSFLEQTHLGAIFKNQTFDNYKLSYFDKNAEDDNASQYIKMKKILDFCIKYSKDFSINSPNLLFKGNPGCGKTYLSSAIGYDLINKGYMVIYTPVQQMIDEYEAEKFNKREADTSIYTDCDLLIIDDLGTEFQTALSENVLFNVINSRVNEKKPMIISTNYTSEEMKGIYHDRLFSRLTYEFISFMFVDKDIRNEIKKRKAIKKD